MSEGSYILLWKHPQQLERNAIVTFKALEEANSQYVKRIIGLPGDKIEVKNHELYINNQKQDQSSYIPLEKQLATKDFPLKKNSSVETVPKNKLFFRGDNRGHSNDS
ncbi:MAG: signal peptidase I [Vagococcus sp.]|uniref:signal peptidase I n=1 Tax=Vagococcus sp. TaxID=1933889 RepID=UPI002FC65921